MISGGNKVGLLSGSSVYLVANVIAAAVPFALLPILTRYMNPTEYGHVAMFQTLLAALAAFTGVSVNGAAGVKYYDGGLGQDEMGHFIGACLQILLATSSAAFAVMYLGRHPLSSLLGLRPGWVLAAVVASASSFVIQLRLVQWQVSGNAVQYGVTQILQALASAALTLVLVVLLMRGAEGRLEAQTAVLVGFAMLSYYLLAKDKLLHLSWRPEYVREALGFGLPLIPHVAGMFLLTSVDRLVINAQLGLAEAGIYMVGVQLTMVMPIVFLAINNAYVPWLFERLKRSDPAEKRQIVRWTYVYFGVVLALSALAFMVGPIAVRLVAGERYRAASQVIGWLALGQAFGGMYLMVTNYIFYSKRTGLLSLSTILSGLINLAFLYVLIPLFGLVGASIAFALAAAFRFALTWIVAQRRHPMPWFPTRPNGSSRSP
jgi:O-antigen/teichoic acid export membrane protein